MEGPSLNGQKVRRGLQADTAQEFISTAVFGTSMSAHHILGLKPVPRVWLLPFKVVRELGSKRRETVWSLSAVGAGILTGAAPSTRGPEWTYRWCTGCDASRIAG